MYDLDEKPPGWVPTWFDQMSEPNGVQTNAMLARISWRTAAAGGRPTIHAEEETPIAVKETERGSTRFTAIGSLFAGLEPAARAQQGPAVRAWLTGLRRGRSGGRECVWLGCCRVAAVAGSRGVACDGVALA